MLKSNLPLCLYGVAFIIGLPSSANPGQPASASGKNVLYRTSTAKLTKKKNDRISLPLDNKQGMTFVHTYIRNNDAFLGHVKGRSEGPFEIIDSVLRHYGLPLQLKYLAVIESELKPSAVSRVGAKGPWQLMPGTAHVLGLTVNRKSDERENYYKSTRAAAKYLRDLHRQFGDWLLVLAAYNGGPVPVYHAIRKAHSRNFWVLQKYLPAESRQHVKKFIATAYYFEGDGSKQAPVASPSRPLASPVVMRVPTTPASQGSGTAPLESDDERFSRLMAESAKSLKSSNELLAN
jgi:membrane-bound lytic murein transglycosylase D